MRAINEAFPPTSTKTLVGGTATDSQKEAGYSPLGIFTEAGSNWSKAFWGCMKQHLQNAPKNISPRELEQVERQCRQEANQKVGDPKPQPLDNGK